ncbi:MAG: branched-chain amino acid ABC transporter permease [candidate division WOR-3 bacterium]
MFGVFPLVIVHEESFLVYFFYMSFLYITLGQGWNLIAGYAGQVSLGQHAFFGLGGYITAIAWTKGVCGYLDPFAMSLSGIGCVLLALLTGIPLLSKLKGDYFALGTLGLGEILRVLFTQGGTLTGGPVGLMLPSSHYKSMLPYYYISYLMGLVSSFFTYLLANSRIGLAWITLGEDEDVARANGVNVLIMKLVAFCIGAFWSGICGSIYAYYIFHVHPAGFFNLSWSLTPILVSLLGGVGTVYGPILGAFLISGLFQMTNTLFPETHPVFAGLFIILFTLFIPGGIKELKGKDKAVSILVSFAKTLKPKRKED